jgi:DNA adenine methylase
MPNAFVEQNAEYTAKRPILRYHGGKWRLAPWIGAHFPKHRIYVEPFCGAASVLLNKEHSWSEYLNELDDELTNFFRVLQDDQAAVALVRRLALTPFSRAEYDLAHEAADDPAERARRLCILSFMRHSQTSTHARPSGFRFRTHRSHTDTGRHWRLYPDYLSTAVERLRGVIIEHRPALEIIPLTDAPDTLFYVDPPYPASTRICYGTYRHELTDDEHAALAECLMRVNGFVVVSGYRYDLYDGLYEDWRRVERTTTSNGGLRTECLWISPSADAIKHYESQTGGQAMLPLQFVGERASM